MSSEEVSRLPVAVVRCMIAEVRPSFEELRAVPPRERPSPLELRNPVFGELTWALVCWGVLHPGAFLLANVAVFSTFPLAVLFTSSDPAFKWVAFVLCSLLMPVGNFARWIPMMRRFIEREWGFA